ncbi:MAG: M24 family metallopeptidase [Candidatus Heimdallarchaeaceae archaeon]
MNLTEEKTAQAVQILNELGIDMWLTYVRKTSEIHDPSLYFLTQNSWYTWQTIFIICKNGRKIAICGRYDVPNVESLNIYDTIIGYDESIKESLMKTLDELKPNSIAINYAEDNVAADGLTHGMWMKLTKMLENTPFQDRLISSSELLAALRGRKTLSEIKLIKEAIRISQIGHKKLQENIRIGMTEQEVEEFLLEFTRKNDVIVSYPPLINIGPKTKIGHGRGSTTIEVSKGDLINIDFGVFYKGYASDIQRLCYILNDNEKEPPEEVKRAFNTVVDAITKGANKLKPGVLGWEVDYVARKHITNSGYPEFKHALGHQIGRNVHDGGCLLAPRWERYGQSPFLKVEEGQVFTLELHIFVEKHGFCSIEEDVLVTKNGCEFLSERQTELPILKLN